MATIGIVRVVGGRTIALARAQVSRRARRDGCIAREMRKPNHAALTAAVALLL